MNQIKAIISDADGTLVNTMFLIRHGQYEAIVRHLEVRGVRKEEIPDYETYVRYIDQAVGGSTRETFEKTFQLAFGTTAASILQAVDFDQLDASLGPIQDELAPLHVHPFPGLNELFSWLGSTHSRFGIFTSGNRRMIVRNFGVSLPELGMSTLFLADEIPSSERLQALIARIEAVFGIPQLAIATCEDVHQTKPDPEGILLLIHQLDLRQQEVVVLGDLPVDIQAARAAGVRAIGITHGFGKSEDLLSVGAIAIVDNLGSLPNMIEAHNSGEKRLFD